MANFSDTPSIHISKGHDFKLFGRPEPTITDASRPARVALQPPDFRYLRPRLKVKKGDAVRAGTHLFESKDDSRIVFGSPGSGTVVDIRFGARRRILEVIVELAGEEQFEEAGSLSPDEVRKLDRDKIVERLLTGGLWPLVRQRPFSKIADPDGKPRAVYVGAMSTEPFLPDPDVVLEGQEGDFQLGLDILGKLTKGKVHLCVSTKARSKALTQAQGVETHCFTGPHPSGNIAVQIYHVDPPGPHETVWYLGAQDTLAVARFFRTGRFPTERVVSLGGSGARERRYFRSRFGASVESLTQGKLDDGELRFVSGGVLTGRKIEAAGFLGFYDTALYVLPEGRTREMLSFMRPGLGKYSLSRTVADSFLPTADYRLDTNLNGGSRNFVMTGIYEDICPVDIIPDQLAKSVLAGDIEESEKHGILDCAECGLCTFICPSKIEVGSIIQKGLDEIVKEG